jgi:hypothetical protein
MLVISESLSAIGDLDPDQQFAVRSAFSEGYNRQNIFLTAFSGLSFLSCLVMWERKARRVKEKAGAASSTPTAGEEA